MRGPTPILDYLSPVNDNFHALSHVTDPLEGVDGLEDMQKSVIRANHEINLTALQGYQVSKAVRAFYDGVSPASLRLDNERQFPSELVSYVDGPIVDLVRNKLLFMFHNPVAGVSVGKKAVEAEPTMAAGLLGGDDKVRSRLAEVAKADQLTIADPWFWLLPSIHPSFLEIYLNQML